MSLDWRSQLNYVMNVINICHDLVPVGVQRAGYGTIYRKTICRKFTKVNEATKTIRQIDPLQRTSSAYCPYKIRQIQRENLPKKRQIVLHVRQNGFRQIIFRQKVPNPTCHEGIQRDAKSWGHGYGKYFQTYQ